MCEFDGGSTLENEGEKSVQSYDERFLSYTSWPRLLRCTKSNEIVKIYFHVFLFNRVRYQLLTAFFIISSPVPFE